MTWEAIDTILNKAWDNGAHALIKLDKTELIIDKENYSWTTYPSLNVLCIYSKQYNREYYCDVNDIRIIVFNESRGNKRKEESTE